MPMTPLGARTFDEASLYLELQPCEVSGQIALRQESGMTSDLVGGVPVRWLDTVYARWRNRARFAFRLPAEPFMFAPGQGRFGGHEPSELIDPGQWLRLADVVTRNLPPLEELAADRGTEWRDRLDLAVAATTEVLKFIKPGEDRVPGYELWTDSGRQTFDEARWRFDKESLEFELDRYRRLLAALTQG